MIAHNEYTLLAQEIKGGIVKYKHITKYKYIPTGKSEWDAYAKTLPSEGKSTKILYFNESVSLYKDLPNEKELTIKQMKTQYMSTYGGKPKPNSIALYIDFGKKIKTEQLEFMTREFLVDEEINELAWRLSGMKKKILDYNCMSADLIIGGDTVRAWFTPKIPIFSGPENYIGLPGLILGVELNGNMTTTAFYVDLQIPDEDLFSKPNKGKKISREKMDKIINEKIEEFNKTKGKAKTSKEGYYWKK